MKEEKAKNEKILKKNKRWKKNGISLRYISQKEFRKLYPEENQGYFINGAVGEGLVGEIGVHNFDGSEFPVYQLNYDKKTHKIDGYLQIDDKTFCAVVRQKKKWLIPVISFLCVLLLGGVYYFMNQGPVLDPSIGKYHPDIKLPENADPTRITIPGYGDIKMKANTKTAFVALWNPDTNPCYFQFRIILTDEDKVIYESGLIPPGYAVKEITFAQQMKKGIYPVKIEIKSFDLNDSDTAMNGGEIITKIVSIE